LRGPVPRARYSSYEVTLPRASTFTTFIVSGTFTAMPIHSLEKAVSC
jgi:hypothetical protein